MNIDNQTAPEDTDLDTFSDMLFNNKPAEEKSEGTDEEVEEEAPEDDTLETEADEVEEVEDTPKPEEKPKSRFQERIDELTAKTKESDRKAEELRVRLEEAIAKLNAKEDKPAEKEVAVKKVDGPQPDEVNEDGSEKYPLGEFDPAYIRDLTRHSFRVEMETQKAADAEAAKQRQEEEARNQLTSQWTEKLETAVKEKYPDMLEKNLVLRDEFANMEPAYGKYLGDTIMGLEYGTDVLYYLATNIEEAKKIAKSGPTAATLALGRLEAKFAFQAEEKPERKPKVSKAPEPPENLNRGSFVNKEVTGDTDDLDLFAEQLFNRKSKKRW